MVLDSAATWTQFCSGSLSKRAPAANSGWTHPRHRRSISLSCTYSICCLRIDSVDVPCFCVEHPWKENKEKSMGRKMRRCLIFVPRGSLQRKLCALTALALVAFFHRFFITLSLSPRSTILLCFLSPSCVYEAKTCPLRSPSIGPDVVPITSESERRGRRLDSMCTARVPGLIGYVCKNLFVNAGLCWCSHVDSCSMLCMCVCVCVLCMMWARR